MKRAYFEKVEQYRDCCVSNAVIRKQMEGQAWVWNVYSTYCSIEDGRGTYCGVLHCEKLINGISVHFSACKDYDESAAWLLRAFRKGMKMLESSGIPFLMATVPEGGKLSRILPYLGFQKRDVFRDDGEVYRIFLKINHRKNAILRQQKPLTEGA